MATEQRDVLSMPHAPDIPVFAARALAKVYQMGEVSHVGFVFQFYNLIPNLTARENVTLVTDIVEHQ